MIGAGMAGGLLLITIGFAFGFLPGPHRKEIVTLAVVLVAVGALVSSRVPAGPVVNACWFSGLVTGIVIYLPRLLAQRTTATAIVCGIAALVAGLAIGKNGPVAVLLHITAFVALVALAVSVVARGWGLALRVMTSWVLAVALLVGSMPYLVTHPGYVPDHRE